MANCNHHKVGSIEAVGQLIQVVVTGQSVNKTGCKLWNGVERWHSKVVHVMVASRSNWSKQVDKGSGCIITSIKVSLSMPVFLLLMDCLFDLSAVEEPSPGDKLGEFNWMAENISPVLNGGDVLVHSFACLNGVWEHPDNLSNVLNSSDELQVLEVIKSHFNLVDEVVTSLEAVLELDQVVMACETIDKTRSEVWHSIKGW